MAEIRERIEAHQIGHTSPTLILPLPVQKKPVQIAAAEGRLAEIRERIKSATAEAGALKQAEAAVRKEQAEVIKQAEKAEKQVRPEALWWRGGGRVEVWQARVVAGWKRGGGGVGQGCRRWAQVASLQC